MRHNEHGIVFPKQRVFVTSIGEVIEFGDTIRLHFAGRPCDMPEPWTLVDGRMDQGTGLDDEPTITVRATNGNVMTFTYASQYSPEGVNYRAVFEQFLQHPVDTADAPLKQFVE